MRRNVIAIVIALACAGGAFVTGAAAQESGRPDRPLVLAQSTSSGTSYRRPETAAPRRSGRCRPALAESKARRLGVRQPHTYNITPNVVRVRGKRRGDRVSLVFANRARCPLLSR